CVRSGWTAPPLGRSLLQEDSLTAHCMRSGQRLLCDDAEKDPRVAGTALVDLGVRSLVLTPIRHEGQVVGVLTVFANVLDAFSALHLAQLDTAARDIAEVLGGESGAEVTLSPRPLFTPEGEVIGATPPASAPPPIEDSEAMPAPLDDDPLEQTRQPEPAPETPSTVTHSFATLDAAARPRRSPGRKWILVTAAVLLLAGSAIWISPAIPKRLASPPTATPSAPTAAPGAAQSQPAANARATLNIDPAAIVAQASKTFAFNVAISRIPDIASVEIDYEPNLIQFVSVADVGPLAKDGQHVVLAHRDDPASGVLKISAQWPPRTVSLGDGAVLSFVFRARRRGTASVSIAPGTRDSQGQSIDVAGSHASVTIN